MSGKLYLFFLILIVPVISGVGSKETGKSKSVLNLKIADYKLGIKFTSQKRCDVAEKIDKGELSIYDEKFNSILNKYRFNGNALVVKNGEVIFKKAQGFSNFKTKEALTESTSFQLASVSKQFTAMAIMMLHEGGKLQYDDYVTKFLPDFPYKTITIKQLLSHTSGIPNYIYLIDKYWSSTSAINNKTSVGGDDVLKLFVEHPVRPYFKAGSKFLYSNSGYVMLALIVEKVSKQPFKSFLKTHIFDKLGMNNTFVYDKNNINNIHNRALSYQLRKRSATPIEDDIKDDIPGDKGVFSTIEDLYKWDKALYANSLIKESTIKEAFEPEKVYKTYKINKTDKFKEEEGYGYGWRIKEVAGKGSAVANNEKVVYHNGWWHGYKASITRYIDDKNTIIILNNTNSHIKMIVSEIEKVLYPKI